MFFLLYLQVEVYPELANLYLDEESGLVDGDLHSPTRSTLFIDISAAAYILTIQSTYSVNDTISDQYRKPFKLNVFGKGDTEP